MPELPRVFTDEWIVAERPAKNAVDPNQPYAFLSEEEPTRQGRVERVSTLFLTNRECPYRCLMCDLWKNTTDETVAVGAIPRQIRWALERLPPAKQIKLYNSGNFFDPGAIPPEDYADIAALVSPFDTVIVESHPAMVGRRCLEFNRLVPGELQVAMGLETVHPEVLPRLNKRMTLDGFRSAVAVLRDNGMQARAFILLRPPFLHEAEGLTWAKRSVDFAFDCGVECCAIIPTRAGNGAMERLAGAGVFEPPSLDSLEEAFDYALGLKAGRVFVDLWDVGKVSEGAPDQAKRIERLARMNLLQTVPPR
jgi:hypothetical protein